MTDAPRVEWAGDDAVHSARWYSGNGLPCPKRVLAAGDQITADAALRLIGEGTAILWQGDFQNARQLLQAMTRRIERRRSKTTSALPEAFHLYRQTQAQRARTLGMLLVPLTAEYRISLRRGQDVQQACLEAWGPGEEDGVVSLRELLGLVSAHEWRKKGVAVPVLGGRIHAHYGVFSPVRGEYLDLVAQAPLPAGACAFDIGTGTGVLAALLARRGVPRVLATDLSPRALACAADNLQRLGLEARVELVEADMFPPGQASLVVCNPPWLPGQPGSVLEMAVYDPASRMLRGFLSGLPAHLLPKGEGWLIISDLAEHLGLRTREELLGWIDEAGLQVLGRLDTRPVHPRAADASDPLHAARAAEVTSLWRLGVRSRPT